MTSFFLLLFAGGCNAVMDITTHKFEKSIFSDFDKQWWNPAVSWLNKYEVPAAWNDYKLVRRHIEFIGIDTGIVIPVVFTDGWHLFKSLMLTSIVVAVVFYEPIFDKWWLDLIMSRLAFGIGFNFCYKWALLKPVEGGIILKGKNHK